MTILAFDSSGKSASAAVLKGGVLAAERFINNGYTHSETLMPMIAGVLKDSETEPADLSLIAVTKGPGSFTGLRIGLATAKGLSLPSGIPVAGISTLLALYYNARFFAGTVCALCDARRNEFYNALFLGGEEEPVRLSPDRAVSFGELQSGLGKIEGKILLVGDGAGLYQKLAGVDGKTAAAPENLSNPRAGSVALAARDILKKDAGAFSGEVSLEYLRLPQAEREYAQKNKGGF